MIAKPETKYRPFPQVNLPDRQWPNRVLTQPPIWASVDLRDGNQALPMPMNIAQKLEMFELLVRCGFKEIEVGFPAASNTEYAFNRHLIEERLIPDDVSVQVLVQAREDLIERTVQSLVGARNVIIHLYNSTSPAQRRVVFGKSQEEIRQIAVQGTKWIKERLPRLRGSNVRLEYSPESFSATEVEFALEVSEAVMEVWQPTPDNKMILNLPDTVEVAMPNVYADQIEWMSRNIKNRESLIFSLHTHNDRNTGTAKTELGLLAGADRVEGVLFGNGERTGNLDIIVVALNLYMHGIAPGLDFSDINGIREIYERCTGMQVPPRHPYAGELVFTAFSGSHQDAIKKGFAEQAAGKRPFWDVPYLTIDPADIGREYHEVIRVNSQSGKGGVAYLLEKELKVALPRALQVEFGIIANEEIDRLGREVQGGEILDLFDREYLVESSPWELTSCQFATAGKRLTLTAEINEFGRKKHIAAEADGEYAVMVEALKGILDPGLSAFRIVGVEVHLSAGVAGTDHLAFAQLKFGEDQVACGAARATGSDEARFKAVISALNRAYPWCMLERVSGFSLPHRLRAEFSQAARRAMRTRKTRLSPSQLEKFFFEEYVSVQHPLAIVQQETNFLPDAGDYFCSLVLEGGPHNNQVHAKGSTAANAVCAALADASHRPAEIMELMVAKLWQKTSGGRDAGKRRFETIAYAQIRFADHRLCWGAAISFEAEEAVARALAVAFNRHQLASATGEALTVTNAEKPARETTHAYPFDQIERKWQQHWLENNIFRALNPGDPGFRADQPKYYVLDMFPYPSANGLHVGHPEGYTATDILARYQRQRGFNVLHAMGWDAFGLPAEQYAIKTGQHPAATTAQNIARFKSQLQSLGFAYDWNREVSTADPGYYRWTQWIFLQIYNSWFNPATGKAEPISTYAGADPDSVRLAYVAEAPVNWCPDLGTVLANEEVIDGRSEIGNYPVERRPMKQWMLRITAYAQRLIDGLDGLDWPAGIKVHQRNWIGRSEGAEVVFAVAGADTGIKVFTTRPDTLFGATYLVLAPEHPLVERIAAPDRLAAVKAYQKSSANKSDLERTVQDKNKTGVDTGAYAVNPVNGAKIPVWVADYVLANYGTGAIMAVPAHDERDLEFAQKFNLPVVQVVQPPNPTTPWLGFTDAGTAVNSDFLDGLPTVAAKARIIAWLEERRAGRGAITCKLRDWLFSRQRYWGEPFPIVWESGRHRAVPESELPVTPPDLDDFRPTGTPEPPLSKVKEWVAYSPAAARETNTMPQWAGSCWYYLRYIDAHNTTRFAGAEAERYWMNTGRPGGVDLYVGGTEHAVLHLLYARFWHKVLFDLGFVSTPEPFQRLVNQGLILASEYRTVAEPRRRVDEDEVEDAPGGGLRVKATGEPVAVETAKMSKSLNNVVNPDDIIREFGADSLRCYEMFMGPLESAKPWSTKQVEGVTRFLARVWRLALEQEPDGTWMLNLSLRDGPADPALNRVIHATVKKVGEDIESLSFNTAIAQLMICANALTAATPRPRAAVKILLQVLNPFAPHLTEELWERLGCRAESGILAHQPWPAYNPAALVDDEIELAVQINGKVRERIVVPASMPPAEIEAAALANSAIQAIIAGRPIGKVFVVPKRLVNIVLAA